MDESEKQVHPLLEPLSEPQQALISTVAQVAFGGSWPTYDYVRRILRRRGLDSQAVLISFPVAPNRLHGSIPYRHFWTTGGAGVVQDSNQVQLTIAGLRLAGEAGRLYGDAIVKMIGKLAEVESEIAPDPQSVVQPDFDLLDALHDAHVSRRYEDFLEQISQVLEHEPPTWNGPFVMNTSRMIRLYNDMSDFIGVSDCDDYLDRVLNYLGSNLPPVPITTVDQPMAIVDELGYLDAIWDSRFNEGPLLGRVQLSSAAGLVRECASQEEFDSRMNAFYDVINGVRVGLKADAEGESKLKEERSLQRLRRRLAYELPGELAEGVDDSIKVLRAALRIRSAVHTGVQRELPQLYGALGLRYPPDNVTVAWNQIRGRCASAIRSIRQAVETL